MRLTKRPPPASVQIKKIQKNIARDLKPFTRKYVTELRKEADTSRFTFVRHVYIRGSSVGARILLANASRKVSGNFSTGDLWNALDRFGTKAHPINARVGGVLAFMWKGSMRFFKRIRRHPGTKPKHITRKVDKRMRPKLDAIVKKNVKRP